MIFDRIATNPGDVYIIAGRPGEGKSTFAASLCENFGDEAVFFSLERFPYCCCNLLERYELKHFLSLAQDRVENKKIVFIDNFEWLINKEKIRHYSQYAIAYNQIKEFAKKSKVTVFVLCRLKRSYKWNGGIPRIEQLYCANTQISFVNGTFLIYTPWNDDLDDFKTNRRIVNFMPTPEAPAEIYKFEWQLQAYQIRLPHIRESEDA